MNKPTFRAWDKINKKMCDVWELDLKSDSEEVLLSDDWDGAWADFRDIILMQSTGLKDKNGVDVYIGDIVKCSSGCPREMIFKLEHGGNVLGGMPTFYLSGLKEGYQWMGTEEVIGNIYNNPELLNEVE